MKNKKLEDDVLKFSIKCSESVGALESDMFSINCYSEIIDLGIDSPIERIFYIAFRTLSEMNFLERAEPVEINGKQKILGIGIDPQHHIGNYRVDFYCYYSTPSTEKSVIVECDSQQFHDRTEPERRYEKIRDRFLQKSGHKVFRFTGKEIKDKPLQCAAEVISYLTDIKEDEAIDYNYISEE